MIEKLLAEELASRVAERGTDFYVLVNEAEALDLASGYVPLSVRGMVRAMLDWASDDRRRAERPVRVAIKKKNTKKPLRADTARGSQRAAGYRIETKEIRERC